MSNVCADRADNQDTIGAELEIDAGLHPALAAALAVGHNRTDSVHSVWLEIGQAIDSASDWECLSAICDQIDTVFNCGQLTPEQAERLIKEVVVRSTAIPELAVPASRALID